MDLNHIELPAFTVAELYRNSLVMPGQKTSSASLATEKIKPKSLGNNRRHILIAVNDSQSAFVSDKDLELLTGILGACKLSLDDVALVNMQQWEGPGYKELTTSFNAELVFLFGITPQAFGLPLDFPHFQSQSFNQVRYLPAPVLAEIAADRNLKTALWNALKKIFNL